MPWQGRTKTFKGGLHLYSAQAADWQARNLKGTYRQHDQTRQVETNQVSDTWRENRGGEGKNNRHFSLAWHVTKT